MALPRTYSVHQRDQGLSLCTLELIVRDLLLSQDHAIVPGQQQSHAKQENLHGVASLESGVLERTEECHGNCWTASGFPAPCYNSLGVGGIGTRDPYLSPHLASLQFTSERMGGTKPRLN